MRSTKITRRKLASLAGLSAVGLRPALAGALHHSPQASEMQPAQRRRQLYELMGDLPPRNRPVSARKLRERERDGYLVEDLELDLNGLEPVPAAFVKPVDFVGPAPSVLFNHSHGGGYSIGKSEFLEGREYLSDPPYAKQITDLGWTGLCIDAWVFGERSHTSEMDAFKAMLWQGQVLWGMMVYDSLKAVDYLTTRPEVDAGRLATVGISMGSTMAWWLAALDERIRVTVDICCLTDFHSLLRAKGLHLHGIYYYVPALLKHFTTAEINALIAPRPHLGIAGLRDPLTPLEGLDIIDAALQKVYADYGAAENWKLLRYDVGHEETLEARKEIVSFLRRHL
jgi:dienelactone hydrolase